MQDTVNIYPKSILAQRNANADLRHVAGKKNLPALSTVPWIQKRRGTRCRCRVDQPTLNKAFLGVNPRQNIENWRGKEETGFGIKKRVSHTARLPPRRLLCHHLHCHAADSSFSFSFFVFLFVAINPEKLYSASFLEKVCFGVPTHHAPGPVLDVFHLKTSQKLDVSHLKTSQKRAREDFVIGREDRPKRTG